MQIQKHRHSVVCGFHWNDTYIAIKVNTFNVMNIVLIDSLHSLSNKNFLSLSYFRHINANTLIKNCNKCIHKRAFHSTTRLRRYWMFTYFFSHVLCGVLTHCGFIQSDCCIRFVHSFGCFLFVCVLLDLFSTSFSIGNFMRILGIRLVGTWCMRSTHICIDT